MDKKREREKQKQRILKSISRGQFHDFFVFSGNDL